jgi:hypothetical protein
MELIAGRRMLSKIAMIVIAKTTSINVNAGAKDLLLLFTLLCVVALSRCRVVNLTYKNYLDPVNPVKRKRKNIFVFSNFSQKKCFKKKYSPQQNYFQQKFSTSASTLMIKNDELAVACIVCLCPLITASNPGRTRNSITNIRRIA